MMKVHARRSCFRGTLSLIWPALIVFTLTTGASAFDDGRGRVDVVLRDTPITVFTYRPSGCVEPTLLFVFHGKGRKAADMRDNATPLADRACLLVLAPLFDEERFPNWRYHRAGVMRKGDVQPEASWTGPIVEALIAAGRRWVGDPARPYILFGHSAGGQFLSRLSAYSPPADAGRIVIANPSVHVTPSVEERAPYGFGDVFPSTDASSRLEAYLALPITIYVGERDTGEKNLVRNAAAMRQGPNRLKRGLHVFAQAWQLAKDKGWRLNWRLVTAPGVGHSSRDMLAAATAEHALGLVERR